MKKILYWQANSGISGDMAVASLLDSGADLANLEAKLSSLNLIKDKFTFSVYNINKAGFSACKFDVIPEEAPLPAPELSGALASQNRTSEMSTVYREERHEAASAVTHVHSRHIHEHGHEHTHEHGAGHEHSHGAHAHANEFHAEDSHAHEHHEHSTHEHAHHAYAYVKAVIENSALSAEEKSMALAVFDEIAAVEAKAHGIAKEEVHFHEVGAVDSIVDVVATVVCLHSLQLDAVIISTLTEGKGQVKCAHGNIPVPVPAVSTILERYGLQVHFVDEEGEHITPTGAAIAAVLAKQTPLPQHYRLLKTGYGAGSKDFNNPNLLLARLLEVEDNDFAAYLADNRNEHLQSEETVPCEYLEDNVYRIDCNLDNITGENFAFLLEELFASQALDVWYTPIFMKKNRPAYELSLLCHEEDLHKLCKLIFRHSKTLGLRYSKWQRFMLQREILTYDVDVEFAEDKESKNLPSDQETVEAADITKQAEERLNDDFLALQAKIAYVEGKEDLRPEYEAVAKFARSLQIPYAEAYTAVLDLAKEFNAMFNDEEEHEHKDCRD